MNWRNEGLSYVNPQELQYVEDVTEDIKSLEANGINLFAVQFQRPMPPTFLDYQSKYDALWASKTTDVTSSLVYHAINSVGVSNTTLSGTRRGLDVTALHPSFAKVSVDGQVINPYLTFVDMQDRSSGINSLVMETFKFGLFNSFNLGYTAAEPDLKATPVQVRLAIARQFILSRYEAHMASIEMSDIARPFKAYMLPAIALIRA